MATIEGFNYASIEDKRIRKLARDNAGRIHELLKRSAACIVEVGKRLIEMREAMGRTNFRAWLLAEFRWQDPTASNYMRCAERFGDLDCLDRFQPKALYALARDNVPASFIEETINRARAGETITHRDTVRRLQSSGVTPQPGIGRPREKVVVQVNDVEALTRSIEDLSTTLGRVASTMSREDRETLADRFLELALQLRRGEPVEAGELATVG